MILAFILKRAVKKNLLTLNAHYGNDQRNYKKF